MNNNINVEVWVVLSFIHNCKLLPLGGFFVKTWLVFSLAFGIVQLEIGFVIFLIDKMCCKLEISHEILNAL